MISLRNLELFFLSTATVIDFALLFSVLERRNRQKALVPVAFLVLGSCLFHGAATLHILTSESTLDWAPQFARIALTIMAAGLLLMPSALLNCMFVARPIRLSPRVQSGFYGLLYLPMLLLIPVIQTIRESPSRVFLEVFAPVSLAFMIWLGIANLVSAIGFYRAGNVYLPSPARKFFRRLSWLLVAITAGGEWVIFYANPNWPNAAPWWTLSTAMMPLLLALLMAYYMLRYQLMQIIIERSLVYGVLLVVALLFHHVFVREIFEQLSQRAKTDLALLEVFLWIALIMAIQPLRQRVSEALRYLMGARVSIGRDLTRGISNQMRTLTGRPPSEIAAWFVDSLKHALALDFACVWLFDCERNAVFFASESPRLAESMVFTIDRAMRQSKQIVCEPHDAPEAAIAGAMHAILASLILLIDHESIAGLVILGPLARGKTLNEEQRTALVLLAEQFGTTLYNSELQARRLAAERQAIHNEKLSTLGLVASSIAHEIKNPLSSIKAIVTVMAEDHDMPEADREGLEIVCGEIDRLSETVTRLLKFVRPARDAAKHCDLCGAVEDTLRVMKHVADQNSIKFQVEFVKDLRVAAPESVMRDIVFNLITNAIDAAGSHGTIAVKAWREGNRAFLCIRDSGSGVSPEIQARLYEPFISDKMNGTGLGLYLIGRHIKEIAGTIAYQNDHGAVFTISIPAVLEPEAAPPKTIPDYRDPSAIA